MSIQKLFLKVGTVLFFILAMASCQEDFSTIGSEIIGTESPNGILDDSQTVISYSKKLTPVQSNRLPAYQMGIYNSPVYGKSQVNFLTQLMLESNDPKFGDSARVDSVFVYVPFFSTSTTVDSVTTYTLDSIYGSAPISIKISESNYFLRNADPQGNFQDVQAYYSNEGPVFQEYLGQQLALVEEFVPSPNGYVFNEGETDEEKLAPALRVQLPNEYFQEKILDKEGSEELRNNNNFKNYLRGIYFQVSSLSQNGNLFLFDPNNAYVSIYYSFAKADDPEERDHKNFKLRFGGVKVNTFANDPLPPAIQTAVSNPNDVQGEENLYLRGGDGIISVVELFGEDLDNNGVADELELLRAKKWIVNEANLIFYVDQDLMAGGSAEPERIMIYDLKNSNVLQDYLIDPTGSQPAANAFTGHFGKLQRGSDGKGQYYKLKITAHISNLINKDSTNVPLGIVVSQNVTNRTTQKLLTPLEPEIKEVPSGHVVSPKGTILHGNASPNAEKRLKLQIYYTEPN